MMYVTAIAVTVLALLGNSFIFMLAIGAAGFAVGYTDSIWLVIAIGTAASSFDALRVTT